MRTQLALVILLGGGTACAMEGPEASFWRQWGDGQAEIASYDLTIPRYAKARSGTAVAIFVTEPFSTTRRVKADRPGADVVPVIKLNLVKDYQTGIYDYNEMTSAFVSLKTFEPLKVSFSRQEWCGHVFRQLLFDAGLVRADYHSYFEGEGDEQKQMLRPENTLSEDTLLLWARGMVSPRLKEGESAPVAFLTSLAGRAAYVPATAERKGDRRTVTVGAAYKVSFTVEPSGEGRVLGWEVSTGEKATLIKSARMKYWQLNSPEGVSELTRLGLKVRPPRTM
jgi:hypothetical protein